MFLETFTHRYTVICSTAVLDLKFFSNDNLFQFDTLIIHVRNNLASAIQNFKKTQVSVQRHVLTNKIVLTRHITVIHHQKRAMKVYSIIIYPHVPIPPTPSSSSLPQDIFPTTNQLVPKKYLKKYFLNNDTGILLRLSPLYQHYHHTSHYYFYYCPIHSFIVYS